MPCDCLLPSSRDSRGPIGFSVRIARIRIADRLDEKTVAGTFDTSFYAAIEIHNKATSVCL